MPPRASGRGVIIIFISLGNRNHDCPVVEERGKEKQLTRLSTVSKATNLTGIRREGFLGRHQRLGKIILVEFRGTVTFHLCLGWIQM